jgi:hypothetical protein
MLEQLVQAWCRVPVATAALLLPQQAWLLQHVLPQRVAGLHAVGCRSNHTKEANYSPIERDLMGLADTIHKIKYFTRGYSDSGTDNMP